MQITVTFPDEFVAQVRARGLSPESYVEGLVAEQAPMLQANRQVSREEFDASLDRLAQYSDKIPLLPIEAFSRESLYEDHD